jgi:hypothetical protein
MKRIQQFLLCTEINPSIIYKEDFEASQNAIEIVGGNFFWGVKSMKDEEEENNKTTKNNSIGSSNIVEERE